MLPHSPFGPQTQWGILRAVAATIRRRAITRQSYDRLMKLLEWSCGVPELPGLSSEENKAVKRDAEAGNPAALYIVGKAYYLGQGLPKDTARGARMLLESAERGFGPALRLAATLGLTHEIELPAKAGA